MPRVDLISTVEASYRLESDESAWLRGIVEAARPQLGKGLGVAVVILDERSMAPEPGGLAASVDCPPGTPEILRRFLSPRYAAEIRSCIGADLVSTASSGSGLGSRLLEHEAWRTHLHPFGIRDNSFVRASDGTGRHVMLNAFLPRITTIPAQTTWTWSRVAAHIAAGLRLRRSLADTRALGDGDEEAVLSPAGKIEHATGPAQAAAARQALRAQAAALDRARGGLRRRDPEEALSIWRGLVAGRWSLLDRFDSDGRRYIIARRNDPRIPDPRLLTDRERQVTALAALGHSNKLIAYELGLSPSTVATHLAAGARKLGIASRAELATLGPALRRGRD